MRCLLCGVVYRVAPHLCYGVVACVLLCDAVLCQCCCGRRGCLLFLVCLLCVAYVMLFLVIVCVLHCVCGVCGCCRCCCFNVVLCVVV